MKTPRLSFKSVKEEVARRSNGWMHVGGSYGQYDLFEYVENYGTGNNRIESGSLKDIMKAFNKKDKQKFEQFAHSTKFIPSAKAYYYIGQSKPSGSGWQNREIALYKVEDGKLVFMGNKKEGSTTYLQMAIEVIAEVETNYSQTDNYEAVKTARDITYRLRHDSQLIIDEISL
jgi:cytochrome b involved in lipid metabolism